MIRNLLGCLLLSILSHAALSQDLSELDLDDLDALEMALDEYDSTSIFGLLDSLLGFSLSELDISSQIALKSGYYSQIVSAGRDLGQQQFGLSYGASYYHKGGAFAGISNYWNSQDDPKNYLTILDAGYLNTFKSRWTYILSYEHYFYHEPSADSLEKLPYTDGLGMALYVNNNKFDMGLDYSVTLGDTITGHKIFWTINANLYKKDFLFFERLSFLPMFGMLFGNSSVVMVPTLRQAFFGRFEESVKFGLMNYSFSLPLGLRVKSFNILLSYQYNIPVALPGEVDDLDNNSFFGLNLSYFIKL